MASGLIHLALGGIGFLALSVAAFAVSGRLSRRRDSAAAIRSRGAGAVVLVGFIGGGALSADTAGLALLWIAVIAGWAWPARTSVDLYRTVPHPDQERRAPSVALL